MNIHLGGQAGSSPSIQVVLKNVTPEGKSGPHSKTIEKRDSILLSQEARSLFTNKANSIQFQIEQLNERKAAILEARSELREKTLETGGSLDDIKYQLELFEEQLLEIDTSIMAIQQSEMEKKQREKDEELQKKIAENTDDPLGELLGAAQALEGQRKIMEVKSQVQKELGHLKSAQQMDAGRGFMNEKRAEKIVDLESRIQRMNNKALQQVGTAYKLAMIQAKQEESVEDLTAIEQMEEL